MDFPSAHTFGLLPCRRTAIALSHQVASQLASCLELFLLEAETDEGEVDEGEFEVIFEPWDDDLDNYIVAGVVLDEDDEDWQEQFALLDIDDDDDEDSDDDDGLS